MVYNELNQKTSMTDWNGTTSYDLDTFGRTVKKTDFEGRITQYTWNSSDQKETMTYPDDRLLLRHCRKQGPQGNLGIWTRHKNHKVFIQQ